MAKSKEKLKARQLRRVGQSIKEIAEVLKVSVGSVSGWCKDIILSDDQIKNLQLRVTDPYYGKKAEYFYKKSKEFAEKVDNLKIQGINAIGGLSKREVFLIGVALYWGEGFKKDCQVGFANIDARLIKFFIFWLEKCFSIDKDDLIVRVTANNAYKSKIHDLEEYWSKEIRIPKEQFSKPFFQKTRWKKQCENSESYHGVLRVKVRRSVDLLRKIHGFIEGINNNI